MRHVLLEVAMNWLRPTKKKFRFLCLFCQEKTLCVKDSKMLVHCPSSFFSCLFNLDPDNSLHLVSLSKRSRINITE